MPASAVIICEQTGRWAAALHREGISSLRETRSFEECRHELSERPAAFLVLEFSPKNAESAVTMIAGLERDFPQAAVAAILPRELAWLEPVLREFGAIAVFSSLLQVAVFAEIIQSHSQRFQDGRGSLTDDILARLPWG